MADYTVDFPCWQQGVLGIRKRCSIIFLHGISEEDKNELAARVLTTDLDSLIVMTIHIERKFQFCSHFQRFHLAFESSWKSLTVPVPREPEAS